MAAAVFESGERPGFEREQVLPLPSLRFLAHEEESAIRRVDAVAAAAAPLLRLARLQPQR